MEMTFPSSNRHGNATEQLADYRALLSSTISRQATSPTAAAVVLAQRGSQTGIVRDNSMNGRARYFAGRYTFDEIANVPYGAFFPENAAEIAHSANYDQAVYQDGSTIGKPERVNTNSSDNLATKLGQEN